MVAVRSLAAGGALWLALLSPAGAHVAHDVPKAADSHAAHMSMQAAPAQQKQPLATGATFDMHHRLWVAWGEGAHVVVAHSADAGGTLSAPVTVNAVPEPVYTSAENRPKIAQDANAEPTSERLRAALDAGWRGDMPRTEWIGRDGAREGLLAADVLDSGLQRAKR